LSRETDILSIEYVAADIVCIRGRSMRLRSLAWIPAALGLCAGGLGAVGEAAKDLPATVDQVTGPPMVAWAFFGVLAFFAVVLVYRGVRAR
jgi:hypothetical protein